MHLFMNYKSICILIVVIELYATLLIFYHSKNIVIHENNAKITDFGISKNQNNQNSTVYLGNFGVIAYMEPKRTLDPKFPYTKSSDIYSLGVLMWEISSGYPPFKESI